LRTSRHQVLGPERGARRNLKCVGSALGWKWSLLCDPNGIPLGSATDGANRHDTTLMDATFDAVDDQRLLEEIETLHLDRGYDNGVIRDTVAAAGITDLICVKKRRGWSGHDHPARPARHALAHRTDQQPAVELRAATAQHGPSCPPPTRSTRPRHSPAHYRETHRLVRSLEHDLTPIKRALSESLGALASSATMAGGPVVAAGPSRVSTRRLAPQIEVAPARGSEPHRFCPSLCPSIALATC
jgi:Transposase DDE domain